MYSDLKARQPKNDIQLYLRYYIVLYGQRLYSPFQIIEYEKALLLRLMFEFLAC